jgi:hypothetical protein
MKIQRLEEYALYDKMAQDFLDSFDMPIKESSGGEKRTSYKRVQTKTMKDLRLNTRLISTFGTGMTAFYPIVDKLMTNMTIDSIEMDARKVVLLTICAFSIIYLEEKKFKDAEEEEILTKDSKSMLEELRMMGIGEGIVKNIKKAFQSIKDIFELIVKHINTVVNGFIDMFAYTTILIPVLNGISYIVGKYDMNLNTFLVNFFGLSMGIATIVTKHGITELVKKLKRRLHISNKDEKEIIDELETTNIKKLSTFGTNPKEGEMINEQ